MLVRNSANFGKYMYICFLLQSMFDQQMAEYREKGEVEKPLLSEDVVRGRAFSEQSVEDVDIEDEIGDEQLKVLIRIPCS